MSKRLAIAFAVIAVVLLIIAARSARNKPPILVDASAQACRVHTLPSPCDGKCARQHSRSYT